MRQNASFDPPVLSGDPKGNSVTFCYAAGAKLAAPTIRYENPGESQSFGKSWIAKPPAQFAAAQHVRSSA